MRFLVREINLEYEITLDRGSRPEKKMPAIAAAVVSTNKPEPQKQKKEVVKPTKSALKLNLGGSAGEVKPRPKLTNIKADKRK